MKYILNEIEKALENKLYYLALSQIFMLPDICSSLIYPKLGVAKRYKKWLKEEFLSLHNDYMINENDFYHFRNSLIHQGSTETKGKFKRLIFILPNNQLRLSMHNNLIVMENNNGEEEYYYNIDILVFYSDMKSSVENWYKKYKTEINPNLNKLVQYHKNGYNNIISGIEVIG